MAKRLREWLGKSCYGLYFGRNFFKVLAELERTQWLTEEELRDIQWAKLKNILVRAYENVPFYRRRYEEMDVHPEDIKSFEDFCRLPYLTKEEVRDNFDLLKSSLIRERCSLLSTSGSTGIPLAVLWSRSGYTWPMASRWRGLGMYEIDVGDKEARIGVRSIPIKLREKFIDTMEGFLLNQMRTHVTDLIDYSEKGSIQFFNKCRKHSPSYLYGYPSAIYEFAKFLEEKGIEGRELGLAVVVTTSEMLFPFQKQFIESIFSCPVASEYGAVETGIMAYQCPNGGMHIFSDAVFVEFIGQDGFPSPPGIPGEVVVTPLHNYIMPLIRYELGDTAIPLKETCECGRKLPLMDITIGRTSDIVITPSGRKLSSTLFCALFPFHLIRGVKAFQVIQKSPDKFVVQIVKSMDFRSETIHVIKDRILNALGEPVDIDIDFVSQISRDKSGKLRPFVSEVP